MTLATIDPAAFAELQATAGDDFVEELIDTFIEEAPAMLSALRAAFASASPDPFRRAAHSLKSNGNTFGALRLGEMARELELQGLPSTALPLDALEAEYARVAAALTGLRDA